MDETKTVFLHAWQKTPCGDVEYCDETETTPDGWSVFVQVDTPQNPLEPFAVENESDHAQKNPAIIRAAELAAEIHGDSEQWESY